MPRLNLRAKRWHRKSRAGCKACKERKVKVSHESQFPQRKELALPVCSRTGHEACCSMTIFSKSANGIDLRKDVLLKGEGLPRGICTDNLSSAMSDAPYARDARCTSRTWWNATTASLKTHRATDRATPERQIQQLGAAFLVHAKRPVLKGEIQYRLTLERVFRILSRHIHRLWSVMFIASSNSVS